MKDYQIQPSLFLKNRQKLLSFMKQGSVALFCSSAPVLKSQDQYFRFRQNSNYFYLTGVDQDNTFLFLNPGAKNEQEQCVLFIEETSEKKKIWDGPRLSISEASNISGISDVRYLSEKDAFIEKQFKDKHCIYVDYVKMEPTQGRLMPTQWTLYCELRRQFKVHEFINVNEEIHKLRMVKEPEEVDAIKMACLITKKSLFHILPNIKPGLEEYHVEADIYQAFIKFGGSGHAFDPIVAGGKNACILHYINNNQGLNDGELVLIDFGALYGYYASDCTRTVPVNGRFTKRQKELYNQVLYIFKKAKELMRPGTTIKEINEKVESWCGESHVKLGLYEKPTHDLIKKYYPHGNSHFMGIDVHDVGGKEEVLKPGMILTCEPGIYIQEEGIGIRIENDILVTDDDPVDLMSDYPIEVDEIESLMNK